MVIYENKLLIGAKSSLTDKLYIKGWGVTDGRNEIPEMEITLADTADAETLTEDMVVEWYRRAVGEATWGDSFFYGYVRAIKKPLRKNEITLQCVGVLGVMFERAIPFAAWGNTHIVDELLAVTLTTLNGYVQRLTMDLDANLAPQVPLERLRLLLIQEGVWASLTPAVWRVQNIAGTVINVAQSFIARPGEMRKLWLKGYQNNGGNVSDLTIQIQTDNGGVPSGTVAATINSARGNWGVGAGNESWVELDFIGGVGDPSMLQLVTGAMYWIVLSVPTQGPQNWYEFRAAGTSDMLPLARRGKDNLNGGAYAVNANKFALYYGFDFEGDWIDLDYTKGEYTVADAVSGAHTVYFILRQLQAADQIGQYSWRREGQVPILYTGQKIVRATYWKGQLTYATVFQQWAKAIASDLYATLDISVTEPASKQYCIQLENSNGLDALNTLANNCPAVARVYKSAAGSVTLEVRDARFGITPVWTAIYTAPQRDIRTFYDGRDSPASQSFIRIVDGSVFRNFVKKVESAMFKDMGGNILSAIGSVAGTGKSTQLMSSFVFDGKGSFFNAPAGAAESLLGAAITVQTGGDITVEDIDQSMAQGPLRDANQLIYVKISRKGVDGVFAVKGIRWSGGIGQPTKLEIGFLNPDFAYRAPSLDKVTGVDNSSSLGKLKGTIDGTVGGFGRLRYSADRQKEDGHNSCPQQPAGVTDCPTSGLESIGTAGMSVRADMPIMQRYGAHTYLPAKVYFLQIGTGAPGGGSCGYKIAEVRAKAFTMASGFVVLQAQIRRNDIGLARAMPQTITEIGLKYADDYAGTNPVQVGAWSINQVSGAGDIWGEQPEVLPGRRVTVAIQVTKP